MQVSVDSRSPVEASADVLALPLASLDPSKPRLPSRAAAVDRALGGRISAIVSSGDFRGKRGQSVTVYPNGEIGGRRVLLVGMGDEGSLDEEALRCAAGTAVSQAAARHAASLVLVVPTLRRVRPPAAAQALAEGAVLAAYRFEAHRSPPEDAPGQVTRVSLSFGRGADLRAARGGVSRGVCLAESQNAARDLSNEPANALPPSELARRVQQLARDVGLRVRVMDVPELKRRKMGGILAVGQGSANPPRLIVLEHNAPAARGRARARSRQPTVSLVGKGITFDSGGISIKPAAGMDEMKHDMSGAAAVAGALRACAVLKVPLHVVGVIAAAENMPSGSAYRPGDVVTAMSGKTIEIMNTDAEGRVVLADALHFARTEFEPRAIIDVATLTGACVIALGKVATGAFGNNERLIEIVRQAGEAAFERAWPMPLWEDHRKQIRSHVADIKNTGGREAGASTAAAFLAHFVGETPWVHLDIAGTGWTSKAGPYQGRGATGVGVRLLLEVLSDWKGKRLD
jgi:leucyl aminopeptidase